MLNSWRNSFILEYECIDNFFLIVDLFVDRWMI